jgi:hypothetical protein
MKLFRIWVLCYCFFASALPCLATDALTGNDLMDYGRNWDLLMAGKEADSMKAGYFLGFVSGIAQTMSLNGYLFASPSGDCQLCIDFPDNGKMGQACAVVLRDLKNRPEDWAKPAFVIVSESLKRAFPMRPGK